MSEGSDLANHRFISSAWEHTTGDECERKSEVRFSEFQARSQCMDTFTRVQQVAGAQLNTELNALHAFVHGENAMLDFMHQIQLKWRQTIARRAAAFTLIPRLGTTTGPTHQSSIRDVATQCCARAKLR